MAVMTGQVTNKIRNFFLLNFALVYVSIYQKIFARNKREVVDYFSCRSDICFMKKRPLDIEMKT